jgi:hypothetical protein
MDKRMDKTTWKCGWREIGGYKKYYRSRWEANYARYLEHARLQGEVVEWKHEPTTFWFEGIKRGVTNYLPDFYVKYSDGREEYHEVKGWMDAKSATKIKRMGKYHPQVKLVVIERKHYMQLEKSYCKAIEGWELLEKKPNPRTNSSPGTNISPSEVSQTPSDPGAC